jgi:D-amino-acid dehydrogenase
MEKKGDGSVQGADIDMVHAQTALEVEVPGRIGEIGQVREAPVRSAHEVHGPYPAPSMGEERSDVAVVGGGLIGLALAYELASLGAQVTLIDAALPGRATDAGAGILSPDTNGDGDDSWWQFAQWAGAHYPDLLQRLQDDGVDIEGSGFGNCGLLSLGLRAHEDDWFDPFAQTVVRRSDGLVREISPSEARQLFPPLGDVHRALYSPRSCRVDGRGMAAALRSGCLARGVHSVSGRVVGVGGDAGRVRCVDLNDGSDLRCDQLAITGGAWSEAMGEWLGCRLPIYPIKGQIVHLGVDADTGSWPIAQPLLTHYLVPWPDGRVAIGGTFEDKAGFSATVTAMGLHELLREGLSVAPGMASAEYRETRVGLRPAAPDDRPVLGALPGWDNAWVATGHGANGLLLGPYSALLLALRIMRVHEEEAVRSIPPTMDPARFA